MLARGNEIDLAELQTGDPVRVLPAPAPGEFFDRQVHTTDGLVDCCPATFADALARCARLFDETTAEIERGGLRLIHKRDAWMHNSWFANLPRMRRGGRDTNPLGMHPTDAAARGLADGAEVTVTSAHGEITASIEHDEDLMPGVVSMVHGWGHAGSPRLRVAHAAPGSNPNALLPTGGDSFEPLSSQAHMTGVPVTVAPLVGAH
jgi:anaerobic selenocysteine-containing dehydrogenase